MKKVIRQIMALAALCGAMAGCSDEVFDRDGEGVGYLRLELGQVDVELSSTTKATSKLPEEFIPKTTNDFMIDIRSGSTSVDGFPKKYSEISAGIELEAGTYTVSASYGENEPLQEVPYFAGSTSVRVLPGQTVSEDIEVALANAMLAPAVSENLTKHYENWTLTVEAGGTSLPLASNEQTEGYLFAKAGQSVNAVFEGTNLLGNETSNEWTVIASAAARTKYVIQCDPDLSVFNNIQLTATATHTYAEGSLTGTDVTLSVNANGAPLDLISGWSIVLQYNGNIIRTCTTRPESGTLMTVAEGWPYVPQGSTLSATFFLRTGETFILSDANLETIPLPEFMAAVSGNTSYSVYVDPAQGAAVANTKDGSSIFDITATTNIAPEILDNPNYSSLLKVKYTTDSGQDSGGRSFGEAVQFNSLAWQKHALSATISFDGVEQTSSPVDCHVTGLPYRADPPTEIDWSGDPTEWNAEYVRFQLAGQNEISKSFYVPSDVNVSVYQDVHVRRATVATEYKLYLGDATLCTLSPGYMSSVDDKKTYDGVMTSSNPTIKCYNSYGNPDSFVEGTNAKVYEIAVSYR